eukprot:339219-Pelagomonas_calceolata.AAC.1
MDELGMPGTCEPTNRGRAASQNMLRATMKGPRVLRNLRPMLVSNARTGLMSAQLARCIVSMGMQCSLGSGQRKHYVWHSCAGYPEQTSPLAS